MPEEDIAPVSNQGAPPPILEQPRELNLFSKQAGVTSPDYDFRAQAVKLGGPKVQESPATGSARRSDSKTKLNAPSVQIPGKPVSVVKESSQPPVPPPTPTSPPKTSAGKPEQPAATTTPSSGSPNETT